MRSWITIWAIRLGSRHPKAELMGLAAAVPLDDRENIFAKVDDLSRDLIVEGLQEVKSDLAKEAGQAARSSLRPPEIRLARSSGPRAPGARPQSRCENLRLCSTNRGYRWWGLAVPAQIETPSLSRRRQMLARDRGPWSRDGPGWR